MLVWLHVHAMCGTLLQQLLHVKLWLVCLHVAVRQLAAKCVELNLQRPS
jgi:hypothetical protein